MENLTKVVFNGAVGSLVPLMVMLKYSTASRLYGLVPATEYDPHIHRMVKITIEECNE